MYFFYLDESGDRNPVAKQDEPFVLVAVGMHEFQWRRFEAEINSCKRELIRKISARTGVTLDLADSDKAVAHAHSALRAGGMVFGYLPHVEQARRFFEACTAAGFDEPHMMEAIVRDYLVRESGVRPENTGLTHTAYIVYAIKKKKEVA